MRLENLFLLEGNLRPIWRCLLSLALAFLASSLAGFAFFLAGGGRDFSSGVNARYGLLSFLVLLALLGAFKIMTRAFEHKPLGVIGLAFHPCWVNELFLGLGIGAVMMVAVSGAEALLGLARFAPSTFPARSELAYGCGLLLFLSISATNEELIFRGYPFQKLVESLGPPGAVALSSACFGLVHLGNPHHTWISTVNTMLVGIPFSIAYLRTRSLWMPVGMHFTWNYVQGFVLGLPVSGLTLSTSVLHARVQGAPWLTGSNYGPEGGLISSAVFVGAGIFLFLSPRIRISERMKELVFGPSLAPANDAPVHILPGPESGQDGPT
jgi:hypothetical protein